MIGPRSKIQFQNHPNSSFKIMILLQQKLLLNPSSNTLLILQPNYCQLLSSGSFNKVNQTNIASLGAYLSSSRTQITSSKSHQRESDFEGLNEYWIESVLVPIQWKNEYSKHTNHCYPNTIQIVACALLKPHTSIPLTCPLDNQLTCFWKPFPYSLDYLTLFRRLDLRF